MSRFKDEIEFHAWRAAIIAALAGVSVWASVRLR